MEWRQLNEKISNQTLLFNTKPLETVAFFMLENRIFHAEPRRIFLEITIKNAFPPAFPGIDGPIKS